MTLDEFLSTGEPTENVRIVAATLLTIVSLKMEFGTKKNTYVLVLSQMCIAIYEKKFKTIIFKYQNTCQMFAKNLF